ncbi:hypothetical protein S245_039315, partial [Arachis hypogaea]
VSKLYRMACDLILRDSAATAHVISFDETWITHLSRKVKFFEVEACQRRSSILPKSERPTTHWSSLVLLIMMQSLVLFRCRFCQ